MKALIVIWLLVGIVLWVGVIWMDNEINKLVKSEPTPKSYKVIEVDINKLQSEGAVKID